MSESKEFHGGREHGFVTVSEILSAKNSHVEAQNPLVLQTVTIFGNSIFNEKMKV